MNVFKWIGQAFGLIETTIKESDISGNQKQNLLNKLAELQAGANKDILEFEMANINALTERIKAESQSESLITRNWRPVCSILLVGCLILSAYGIGNPKAELWHLAEIIIGVAGGGRSLEKIASVINLGKK